MIKLRPIKLRPGDYVNLSGLSIEEYDEVAKKFMEAGAQPGEYPDHNYAFGMGFGCFGWRKITGSLWHGNDKDPWSSFANGRKISVDDLLSRGQEKKVDRFGYPPVGSDVEYYSKMRDQWIGPAKLVHVTKKGIAILEYEQGGYDIASSSNEIRLFESKEDSFVEDVMEIWESADCDLTTGQMYCAALVLYRSGYRKGKFDE